MADQLLTDWQKTSGERMRLERSNVLAEIRDLDAGEFCGLCRTLLSDARVSWAGRQWFKNRGALYDAINAYVTKFDVEKVGEGIKRGV